MRDSSLPSPDHSCNIARPVSLPCDDLMTQICTMSSPLSGSSGAYCSEPLILLSATRTPTQAQTSCFFRIFFTFFQIFSCLRIFYHIFDGFTTFCHSQFINIWYNFLIKSRREMMVAEKRIYSTTALQNCYRAFRFHSCRIHRQRHSQSRECSSNP